VSSKRAEAALLTGAVSLAINAKLFSQSWLRSQEPLGHQPAQQPRAWFRKLPHHRCRVTLPFAFGSLIVRLR
jgi:hypothetical protein